MWSFDVFTASHDDLKTEGWQERQVRSRVNVSADEFPDWRVAMGVAGCLAVAIHGGMPTSILPRY